MSKARTGPFALVAAGILVSMSMGGCPFWFLLNPDGGDPREIVTLTVSVEPADGGTVTLDPPGGSYAPGTVVTLTAEAADGFAFVEWQGDTDGANDTIQITVDIDMAITAVFEPTDDNGEPGGAGQYSLTVNVQGQGSVDPPVGEHTYDAGQIIALTATSTIGWRFDRWQGDLDGSSSIVTLVIDDNKTVTAVFVEVNLDELLQEAFDLSNTVRESKGMAALAWNDDLAQILRTMPQDMIDNSYFGHVSPDGLNVAARARAAGYAWRWLDENLAAGYNSAEQVVTAWMANFARAANLMHTEFTEMGMGLRSSHSGRLYWVQVFAAPADAPGQQATHLVLETSLGWIVIELDEQAAPITTQNIIDYVDEGFYDGTDGLDATIFHRVEKYFMIQAGGFTEDLTKKETHDAIVNESDNGRSNVRGTVGMARTDDADSATSQFFINHNDNSEGLDFGSIPNPDGYAVFGHVIDGMDVVDAIAETEEASSGDYDNVPVTPILILHAEVDPP